jgi:hypothetical protein
MYQKYTYIIHWKALQKLPKHGFLVWKYTIWQPCCGLRNFFGGKITRPLVSKSCSRHLGWNLIRCLKRKIHHCTKNSTRAELKRQKCSFQLLYSLNFHINYFYWGKSIRDQLRTWWFAKVLKYISEKQCMVFGWIFLYVQLSTSMKQTLKNNNVLLWRLLGKSTNLQRLVAHFAFVEPCLMD